MVNKVEINGEAVIDLTDDSVTPDALLEGHTAHDKSGVSIVGRLAPGVTSVNGETGDIVIGGRNLVNTADPYQLTNTMAKNIVIDGQSLHFVYSDPSIDTFFYIKLAQPLKAGHQYTLSFDCEGVEEGNSATYMIGSSSDTEGSSASRSFTLINGHIVKTFRRLTDVTNGRILIDDKDDASTRPSNTNIRLSNFKLENGNVATDYTPAPEELEARIAAIEAKLGITAAQSSSTVMDVSSPSAEKEDFD